MKAMIFTVMPMFVCLFWASMLALELTTDGKNRPRLHLMTFYIVASILYFGHCVFFNHSIHILPLTDTLYLMANLSVYPLYYFYISSLTTRKGHDLRKWVMLVPAIILGGICGGLYIYMSPEEIQQFVTLYLYEGEHTGLMGTAAMQAIVHDVSRGFFFLLVIPTFVYGRHHLLQYERLLKDVYADVEGKSLTSIRYMLFAFVLTAVASFVANLIGRQQFDEKSWLLAIPSTLFSALLFVIGYVGYRQQFSMQDIEADEQQADAVVADQPAISELRKRIELLMEQEQLYRQPNFKIVDLVQRLNTNRNYIYLAINREMGLSFSEYINRMRINYATLLMSQHPDMSLSEIAEQSGFTSSTSFYRNFKQFRGVGPKEYKTGRGR